MPTANVICNVRIDNVYWLLHCIYTHVLMLLSPRYRKHIHLLNKNKYKVSVNE
jgi:hypothetical protein